MLDRVRTRFGRARDRSAPEVFTARSSPSETETPRPERIVPTAAPTVRVHPERVSRPSARVELTPAQALELARDGAEALHRQRPRAR
jgi:hypothetical protein